MLYWFGVYALVIVAVAVPFAILYTLLAISWLGLAAVRSTIRSAKLFVTIPQNPCDEHWRGRRVVRMPARYTALNIASYFRGGL
jgi:hypothetical protein